MQSVGSSLQSVTSFPIFWFISYCCGVKCVLLSQCCSCSDCEGQEKAQAPHCSSPWSQKSKQLHFHSCSTSPAPHDAATQELPFPLPASCSQAGGAKKKQFLDSPAAFITFVALQMMKPGSITWLHTSNLCRFMKSLYFQFACSLYLTQTSQCCEINLCFKISFWRKRPVRNGLIGVLWKASASWCFPEGLPSYPLLGGMPQHAVC